MSEAMKSKAARDRNLLLGVIAVQLKYVSAQQLAAAAGAWASETSSDLGQVMVELGFINETNLELLNKLLESKIEEHGGDANATLASFGGEQAVHESFAASIQVTEDGIEQSVIDLGSEIEEDKKSQMQQLAIGEIDSTKNLTVEHPGRYNIIGEHGRGAIGRILVAFDRHIGREVAQKELITEHTSSPDFLRQKSYANHAPGHRQIPPGSQGHRPARASGNRTRI